MRLLVVLLTLICLGLTPSLGRDLNGLSKPQRAEVLRYAVNNSLFTLYHELAHLLIDKLNLPVLGMEEDAADNMATYFLLEKKTPDANRTLQDAVVGWMTTARNYQAAFSSEDYTAGYSPDRHRAYQIMCMMVGADGAAFRKFADSFAMSSSRQYDCAFDYQAIAKSIEAVLPKQAGGTRVEVKYFTAGRSLQFAETVLKNSGIIEQLAEDLRSKYKVPGRVLIAVRRCDEPNAFYATDTTEIIFCYELMKEFLQTPATDIATRPNSH